MIHTLCGHPVVMVRQAVAGAPAMDLMVPHCLSCGRGVDDEELE